MHIPLYRLLQSLSPKPQALSPTRSEIEVGELIFEGVLASGSSGFETLTFRA